MLLAGCQTTEPVPIPCPEPLPPPEPPVEAMEHSKDRSKLPEDFGDLGVEEALKRLLQAHLFDIQTLQELEAKHKALSEYIKSVLQQGSE